MKFKVSRRTIFGTILVALAFSDTIKNASTWLYPFIMFSILAALYFMNVVSGHSVKRGEYIFKKYLIMGGVPYALVFVYSIFLITINHQGTRFINRSLGSSLIAAMTVMTSATLVYIFKKKAADVLCYGLILNYVIHIVLNLGKIGVEGLIEHIVNPLNTYQNIFELHSAGFTLNLLLIYYIAKRNKEDRGKIVAIFIILYLIMKRIAFVGLLIALIVWFITDVILKRRGKKKYFTVMWMLAISAFCYVAFICLYPEIFKALMIRLGILNRYLITNSFSNYYSFKVSYLGRGFGFISVLMPEMDIAGASVAALHNDVLKDFIEEGFIGFCLIYYYLFIKAPKVIIDNKSKRCYTCVTMMLVYTFITLLTDNVLDYVAYTCTWFTIYGVIHMYGNEVFPEKDISKLRKLNQKRQVRK